MSQTIPKIEVPKNEYKVKRGDDVTMEVKFTATPPPVDEWSVSGAVLKKSNRVSFCIFMQDKFMTVGIIRINISAISFFSPSQTIPSLGESSATLTIKKVEETDAGSYKIKLKNESGEASAELTLILIGEYNLFTQNGCSSPSDSISYFEVEKVRKRKHPRLREP